MFNDFKKVLVLAPHTDDGEFGCGGTIAKLAEEGKQVYYAAFSPCEQSVLNGYPKDILVKEVKEATRTLGIKPDNLFIYKYPVRLFPQNRQKILEDLIKLKKNINPDLVFSPSLHDIHQDHLVIAKESLRAFRDTNLLGYEALWNNITFEARCLISLEKRHIEKKIKALNCYQSQQHRFAFRKDFILSWAKTRGGQIRKEYAEAFEIIRLVF
jgi:LmbE family N-acetylglucosaminyl deacetylase